MADFFILKAFQLNPEKILAKRGLNTGGKVQKYIDSKVLEYSEPYVPKDTGALIASGITHTQIGSGQVKYRTVYARRWYYMPAKFAQGTGRGMNTTGRGNYWFERMKKEKGQQILKGAKRIAGE